MGGRGGGSWDGGFVSAVGLRREGSEMLSMVRRGWDCAMGLRAGGWCVDVELRSGVDLDGNVYGGVLQWLNKFESSVVVWCALKSTTP